MSNILDYDTVIQLKFGELGDLLQWCNDNCNGDWTLRVESPAGLEPGTYSVCFAEQQDLTTFLMWRK